MVVKTDIREDGSRSTASQRSNEDKVNENQAQITIAMVEAAGRELYKTCSEDGIPWEFCSPSRAQTYRMMARRVLLAWLLGAHHARAGDSMMPPTLEFSVRGIPAPQGSKRHVGRGIMVESSKKVRPWRDAVRAEAVAAWDSVPLDEPVRVHMVFTFLRPASHYRTGKNAGIVRDTAPHAPQGAPDLSKLIRSTEDALTEAGVWRDDARVVEVSAWKVYAGEHPDALDSPGAVVRVWAVANA